MDAFMVWYLVKHGENFTLFYLLWSHLPVPIYELTVLLSPTTHTFCPFSLTPQATMKEYDCKQTSSLPDQRFVSASVHLIQ